MKDDSNNLEQNLEGMASNTPTSSLPLGHGINLAPWQEENASLLSAYGKWLHLLRPKVYLFRDEKEITDVIGYERVTLPIVIVSGSIVEAIKTYLKKYSTRENPDLSPNQISEEVLTFLVRSETQYSRSFNQAHPKHWQMPR